ncbi:MAG: hypothetical protein K0Q60_5030, partial [Microvirga sp.]|nr:hypothetical protein [Microvirga sp.]
GVVFVDLSPLTDPNLVMPTIAAALGVHETAGQPLFETLMSVLTRKRLLLVLDNCERVLAAAPTMAALVSGSPQVTILATSREPLRVRGEREFPLLPLPLPGADHWPTLVDLADNPAVALFVERATATTPDFALTAANASSVAAICQRLDGLPLAIELAASRIRVLPPAAMLARLEHRLPLLTGGGRDLPARQQTMRDAIAWSYDLLDPDEQALFRYLAIFAGGFTLEAADAVAGSAAHEGLPVLDGITALVEQSLVRQMTGVDDNPRYLMLETVREFGLERLAASGEEANVRRRHAAHFLQVADTLEHRVQMFMNVETLRHVAAEHDNVRLALAWFDEQGEIDALLRLSATLYALWFARGFYQEGSQWVERALARAGERGDDARVQALVAAGMLAVFQGAYDRAEVLLDQGVQQARALHDPFLISESLIYTSLLSYRRGEYRQAEGVLAEAQGLLSGLDDRERSAMPSQLAGDIALAQEHFDLAAAQYEESLARFEATGNTWQLIDAQAGLAGVRFCTGHLADAMALAPNT